MSSINAISAEKLARLVGTPKCPTLVDVRTDEDFASEPRLVPGSVRRPADDPSGWATEFAGRTFTAPRARCRLMAEAILRHVDPGRALRVLDLGCGTGEQIFELARALPAADLTGIDISRESIRVAQDAQRTLAGRARLSFLAADYMDFRAAPFDVILSDGVLHTIAVPSPQLFAKIAGDLTSGGILVYTMPYPCLYNRALTSVRRVFRSAQSPLTDSLILAVARGIHGRRYDLALLRERVPYMYLLPERDHGPALREILDASCGLELVGEYPFPHASIAQLKHRMAVFRKREPGADGAA